MASPAIGTGTGEIQTASQTTGTSISVSKPTNAATNDLLIAVVANAAARTLTATGWTSIGAVTQSIFSNDVEVFWRLHDGSSSYSFSWSGDTATVAGIARVTGADTSSPVDVSATYESGFTSATAQTAPSVTTTVADTLLLNFYSVSIGGATWVPASSQTEVFDVTPGLYIAMEMTKLNVASSGATGTKTSTASSAGYWVSMSVAIKPAPAKPMSSVPMVIG